MSKITDQLKTSQVKKYIFIFSLIYFSVIIPLIHFYCNKNLDLQSEQLKFVFLPSIATIIPIIFGLSTRNASISDRARSKATELLKCNAEDLKKHTFDQIEDRRNCLVNQINLFDARFMINQWALVSTWFSLILALISGIFILNSDQKIYLVTIKILYFIVALIIYSVILNLSDIYLGSKTLSLELQNIRKKY